jgi:hypothetical protein
LLGSLDSEAFVVIVLVFNAFSTKPDSLTVQYSTSVSFLTTMQNRTNCDQSFPLRVWFMVRWNLGVFSFCALLVALPQVLFAQGIDACRSSYEASRYEQALAECRAASIAGEFEAKYLLGKMYSDGNGVEADQAIAYKLIESAAYADFADAQVALGSIYWNGHGTEKDAQRACNWWQRATAVDHPVALEKYGVCFMLGKGREKNIASAYRYLSRAADKGSAGAKYIVNRYKELFPTEEQVLTGSAQ